MLHATKYKRLCSSTLSPIMSVSSRTFFFIMGNNGILELCLINPKLTGWAKTKGKSTKLKSDKNQNC